MTEVLTIVLFLIFAYRLLSKLGRSFPLFELAVVLYLLQYGIAPLLEYGIDPYNSMSVPKSQYITFAFWSCLALILGLFHKRPKFQNISVDISPKLASVVGRVLLVLALVGTVSAAILPFSMRAILNFFIILKFPGIYALIFSENKIDKWIIAVFALYIASSSILNAGLIEFIVFGIFFVMFYGLKYPITKKLKVITFITGFLFLSVYQSVKLEYRSLIWEEDKSWQSSADWQTKLVILTDLISVDSFIEAFNTDVESNASIIQTVHRLNQGWQTSMALAHVPYFVPFENGKALKNDLLSSIMPRFLLPDKRVVNDNERFNYYTGYILNEQTSMSIGVLGDFYINFGVMGTIIAMFIFGLIMARLANWLYIKFIRNSAINLIWLPFIFSYFIRPGNEFYMVLNHIIKALVIFYLVVTFVYPYIRSNYLKSSAPVES